MFVQISVLIICLLLSSCGGGAGEVTPLQVQEPKPPSELRILVLGQSISSNCNDFVYGPSQNVFQIDRQGTVKAAQDPFEWADCSKGSMWMPLGTRVIESGVAAKVIFMPIGVAGSRVQDWQEGGSAFGKLNDAIALIKKNGIRFDMAFWHQGSANYGTARDEYTSRLLDVITYVNKNVEIRQWLIGVHSRCWGGYDTNVEAAQILVGNAASQGRFPGANSNLLGNEYRVDECHLNKQGQEQMAAMWLEAIKNANARR
jgi:hypothetical protein